MKSFVLFMALLEPRMRRLLIMVIDVAMVLLAIPLSLSLSLSHLSFDAYSTFGLTILLAIGVFSHLLFRLNGLYNTVWRFASTPDFFNIVRSCATLAIGLYLIAITIRNVAPVTGLNERQFIVLFLVTFAMISAPRLLYRYLREGAGWRIRISDDVNRYSRSALFIGSLDEADVLIRFTRSSPHADTRITGILSLDENAPVGTRLRGVPVIGVQPRLTRVLEDYVNGSQGLDLVIFGHGAEKLLEEFSELVRLARTGGIEVVQFSGFSKLGSSGSLVLEAVEMETILRRPAVPTDLSRIDAYLQGKRVLVTGGAGSIGRTLVRRALQSGSEAVLVTDNSEFSIFRLGDLIEEDCRDRLSCRILDVGDKMQFGRVVRDFKPDIIFHAAALKHVPLLERNWVSAIKTNVFATLTCAEVAAEYGVPQFVLISSDKAANPRSVLGLTKRFAEQIVNSLHSAVDAPEHARNRRTQYSAVRFGNVFGSDGSVATVFERQIRDGGPVTITDRSMTRYLMTIGEAVDLVIVSAATSSEVRQREDVSTYMLDMGEPVSILAVAETMIRLAGKKPYSDIPIEVAGIRPGEKIHEVLCAEGEEIVDIGVSSVFGLRTGTFNWTEIRAALNGLRVAIAEDDKEQAVGVMEALFRPLPSAEAQPPIQIAV